MIGFLLKKHTRKSKKCYSLQHFGPERLIYKKSDGGITTIAA